MPNKEHVETLMAAIASMSMAPWNHWRIENPSIRPNLLGVELADTNLSYAYLSYADLSHADLSRTNLHHATLRYADLSSARLQGADLSEADLSYAVFHHTDLKGAILRNAKLHGANLVGADLTDADLSGADLAEALLDTHVSGKRRKRFSEGVSYLEKLAMGLFSRSKDKDLHPPERDAKPHPSDKRLQ